VRAQKLNLVRARPQLAALAQFLGNREGRKNVPARPACDHQNARLGHKDETRKLEDRNSKIETQKTQLAK
jgi:hypothetical protein